MSNFLRRATGPSALLMLILTACSQDARNAEDPLAVAYISPAAATVVIDDVTYEYGCPDFPCPVTALIKDHIDRGMYNWMAPGTFPKPTIYLYVLRTPVQLRLWVPAPVPPDPPPFIKLAPYLTGPASMLGTRMDPLEQLACTQVQLQLHSPDGRQWTFLTGERTLSFMEYNSDYGTWEANGTTWTVPLYGTDWEHLVSGIYGVYPGYGTSPYEATFTISVRSDDLENHVLSHTMMCEDAVPPEPPAPSLIGPEVVKGQVLPDRGLVCSEFTLTLVSPDEGPWSFLSGAFTMDPVRWGSDGGRWVSLGKQSTHTMHPDDWQNVQNGDLQLQSKNPFSAYYTTFTASVRRAVGGYVFDHEVSHKLLCVAPEFYPTASTPR